MNIRILHVYIFMSAQIKTNSKEILFEFLYEKEKNMTSEELQNDFKFLTTSLVQFQILESANKEPTYNFFVCS